MMPMRNLFLVHTTLAMTLVLLVGIISVEAAPALSSAGSEVSTLDMEALDAYITAQMSKHGIQGISLAVTSGTEITYLKGYGTAGQGRPMTPQTPMYIGSQSKSFTGLAIAQLIEQGKIDPNDPVQTYIPWFKVADEEASRRITVNHLLHHTSGLSESGFSTVLPDQASNEDVVRALTSAELTAPVGVKHQYFNIGYDVLAVIVQNVSGMLYEAYLQKHILDPLEMTRTYTDPVPARANGLAQGYSRFFGFTVPQEQPRRVFELSAGYMISTAEDMARFTIVMDNAGLYQGKQLLSFDGMEKLFTPVQGYGMGWFVEQGHIFHGGANETFKTFVDIYPLRDLSIVLLINQGYMFDHYISAPQIFKGVEAIVLGRIPPPVSEGWSVKSLGWILLAFVLALSVFQLRNLLLLRGWKERARHWSIGRKLWDIALSFLIPTIILITVFAGMKSYFGYRFNLTYQMFNVFRTLSDIAVLMILGSLPYYLQGCIKSYWLLTDKLSERKYVFRQSPQL